MKESPYISIVVTGRNDNYGGDFYQRIQNQLTHTAHLAKTYRVPVEYVLVNYNPISGQPTLREALQWPEDNPFFTVQLVTVPTESHEKLVDPEVRKTVPLFEFIAKNAGIRRASGAFILTTNADIIFDPGIFSFLAGRSLREGVIYRANRLDYWHSEEVPSPEGEAYHNSIRKKVFKFFLQGNTFTWRSGLPLGWRYAWLRFRNAWKLSWRKFIMKLNKFFQRINWDEWQVPPEVYFHANASGDFLLASRGWYQKMRGFPENTYISTHTDALMMGYAITDGLQQVTLKAPVYHQEHERRFDFGDGMGDVNMQRMYRRLQKELFIMAEKKTPLRHNPENWGLKDEQVTSETF